MIEAYKKFWGNYFNFSGVATRSEYWYVWLFNNLVCVAIIISMGLCETEEILNLIGDLYGIYGLLILIPSLSILFRRLHDSGHSGWYCLFWFIPLIGTIVLLVLLCTGTKTENNKYL